MIIYTICLILGLLFTVASAFLGHLFGGHDIVGTDGQADAGGDTGGVPGVSVFSPTVLASFITSFGAFGLIFSSIPATQTVWICAPVSLVGGVIVAMVVMWLFNAMFRKTQSSSEGRVAELIGQSAAIISPIPENGVGEISYVQAGSRYTAPARHEKGQPVGTGKTVKITRIVGTQFYVATAGDTAAP